MFPKSIRWRLQIWLAFLLVCILSGFGLTAYQLQRNNRLSQIDEELERRVSALSADVRARPPGKPPFDVRGGPGGGRPRLEPRPEGPPFEADLAQNNRMDGPPFREPRGPDDFRFGPRVIQVSLLTSNLFGGTSTNDFYYVARSRNGSLLLQSTNAPADLALPETGAPDTRINIRTTGARREALQFTEMGDAILVGRSIRADLDGMRQFAGWLFAAGAAVLALGLGGGWWLVSRAIRPVEEISAAASRISAGNLAERVNISETDSELGRLGGVLNSTFARLEAAFAQQKQFTADASHELRTPIAVLISEAQTALARERTAAEYRETVAACLDTAQQMRRLTHSLLELARFDAGQEPMERLPVDLGECARACVDLIRPLAQERRVAIHFEFAPAGTAGDAVRLGQVITNLLTNAIHYNREGGEIRIATRSEGGMPLVTISDTGVGIDPSDLPHVFDRFYRGDKSRSSNHGRTGLGLAICKAIVEAHGGTIELASQKDRGTTVTLRFPAPA